MAKNRKGSENWVQERLVWRIFRLTEKRQEDSCRYICMETVSGRSLLACRTRTCAELGELCLWKQAV